MLDEAGLTKAKYFLTNSLNEELIRSLRTGVCADTYGVGDEIAVSSLILVLVEYIK